MHITRVSPKCFEVLDVLCGFPFAANLLFATRHGAKTRNYAAHETCPGMVCGYFRPYISPWARWNFPGFFFGAIATLILFPNVQTSLSSYKKHQSHSITQWTNFGDWKILFSIDLVLHTAFVTFKEACRHKLCLFRSRYHFYTLYICCTYKVLETADIFMENVYNLFHSNIASRFSYTERKSRNHFFFDVRPHFQHYLCLASSVVFGFWH